MEATTTRMTREQYYEVTVQGDRKQLVDGVMVVMNEAKLMHGVLQQGLQLAIGNWIAAGEGRGLVAPATDVTLDDYNVYGPDVIWWSEERKPRDLNAYPEGVPDLCVEIRSPGTWRYDVGAKRAAYEHGGLPELWLVDDRSQTVLVYRRSVPSAKSFDVALEIGPRETLTTPQMPGFELPLDRLFPG